MSLAYVVDDLFETHDDYNIVSYNNGILIVDNWYKNYDSIIEILMNTPVPRWKWTEGSRNFVDYYDCRHMIPVFWSTNKTKQNLQPYYKLLSTFFNINTFNITNNLYEFNYYKNIKSNVPNTLQHFPHVDYDINCLIYLDKICSGGTAIYEINSLFNEEEKNLLFDISGFGKEVIQSKPNRMVMFSGKRYHGGYIKNHNSYINNWRINQVLFFKHDQ